VRKDVVRAYYFSVGPSLFGALAERLHMRVYKGQGAITARDLGMELALLKRPS
jgi:glucose-6-phosphate 1-dehydrogenase